MHEPPPDLSLLCIILLRPLFWEFPKHVKCGKGRLAARERNSGRCGLREGELFINIKRYKREGGEVFGGGWGK